jgi:AbrB family looped-hinge helix DNA binding protein
MAGKTKSLSRARTGRVGQRRQVVIPREIFERLRMRAGDLVSFTEKPSGVLVEPKRAVNADDTLTPEEAKIVRRGEAQLKRGDSKAWSDIKHALAR